MAVCSIPEGAIKIHIPDVSQSTFFTCGAAVTHAICAYWGLHLWYDKDYVEDLCTNRSGTHPRNIVKYLRSKGLKTEMFKNMDLGHFRQQLDLKRPIIVLVQAWGRDYDDLKSGHYVVAIGYDEKRVYFEDPMLSAERGYLTWKQFEKRWKDQDVVGRVYDRCGIVSWNSGKKSSYLRKARRID